MVYALLLYFELPWLERMLWAIFLELSTLAFLLGLPTLQQELLVSESQAEPLYWKKLSLSVLFPFVLQQGLRWALGCLQSCGLSMSPLFLNLHSLRAKGRMGSKCRGAGTGLQQGWGDHDVAGAKQDTLAPSRWGRRMGQPFGDGAPALQSGPCSCWEALSCSPPASSQQRGEYETCSSFSCSAGVRDHHKAIKKNLFCEPCPKEAHQRLSCQNSQGQESPPPLSLIWKDLVVCLLMCSVWLSGY